MTYQDQMVKMTQRAVDDICRAALALPPGAVEWTPGGEARSALDQMREVAQSAAWLLPLVNDQNASEFAKHPHNEPGHRSMPESAGLETVGACAEAARKTTTELCQAIAAVADAKLECEVRLPFGGGLVMTFADLLGMHHWNLVYHLGQINQIALAHGDKEMH
ncbi:MAG: DinB family protein [Fimbriimonadaceae bacterium]